MVRFCQSIPPVANAKLYWPDSQETYPMLQVNGVNIAWISPQDGKLHLWECGSGEAALLKKLGLDLDSCGRIKVFV
jgi:hypothetical protein